MDAMTVLQASTRLIRGSQAPPAALPAQYPASTKTTQAKAHASPYSQALKTQAQPRKFLARAASLDKTQPPAASIAREGGLPARHTRQNARRAASESPPRRQEARAASAVPQGEQVPLAKHASRVKCERAAIIPMRRSVTFALRVSTKTNMNKRPACRACQESTRRTPTAANARSAASTRFQTKRSSQSASTVIQGRRLVGIRVPRLASSARQGNTETVVPHAPQDIIAVPKTRRWPASHAMLGSIKRKTERPCACSAFRASSETKRT